MLNGKRILAVMPAYNAAATVERTYGELPHGVVDEVLLVDDASSDATASIARALGILHAVHPHNQGYGANQKSCYRAALKTNADVVVMIHPDYQYSPALVPAIAALVTSGEYDAGLGSRILGGTALSGGMPLYKYVANRALTLFQNLATGAKLSEYHTGFRAYSRALLEAVPWEDNSDDFIFDNEILMQILARGYRIGEVSVPTRYFKEASSINFRRSVRYGLGVVRQSVLFASRRRGRPDQGRP